MYRIYAIATGFLSLLLPLWLLWRMLKGKEDRARWRERLGYASLPRPHGLLLWLHAASVGEANSVLPLIRGISARWPDIRLLLTTGTRTSAALMARHLPKNAIHQYVPVDTPGAAERFLRHWRPDIAFFVESEFWPNLIAAADRWQCFMGIINARLSERSFAFWRKYPALIAQMLACFNVIFAQSEGDAARLRQLGAKNVRHAGNAKYDADPLPCDESALLALKSAIGARPVWLAASTHPGEEEAVMQAHRLMAVTKPGLLTIIVPRHPARGGKIAAAMSRHFRTALRSRGETLAKETSIYVADTLGELGIFYRLSDIVFMGGSLIRHGGQNPLEPARLSCAIAAGMHTHNFADMYQEMEQAGAVVRVRNGEDMAAQVSALLSAADRRQAMQAAAKSWLAGKSGATARILDAFAPIFEPKGKAA